MAERHPDAVNPTDGNYDNGGVCFYFYRDGRPGCIIGHVIASLGGTLDDVKSQTAPPSTPMMRRLFADYRTAWLAERVQTYADNGDFWLDAYSNASRDLEAGPFA